MDAVEDPTLPLTRGDIDRLRRRSGPAIAAVRRPPPKVVAEGPIRPLHAADEFDLFESLEKFDHIGFGGTPANMQTSGQRPVTSGEIEVARPSLAEIGAWIRPPAAEPASDGAAPRARSGQLSGSWLAAGEQASQLSGSWGVSPSVIEPALVIQQPPLDIHESEDAHDEFDIPTRRHWPWVMALAGAAIAIAVWQLWPQPEPVDAEAPRVITAADVPKEPDDFTVPEPAPTVELAGSDETVEILDPEDRSTPGRNRPAKTDVSTSPACRQAREDAKAAYSNGQWESVEASTRRKDCWTRPRDGYALRLRALFELGRFDECIKLAKRDNAAAVKKWKKTCEDAKI